ncbi:MAG: hypothetical protein AAF762_14905 [Pseudomonadota bacterium]
MAVAVEADVAAGADAIALGELVREVMKLRATVTVVPGGSLPNDGKVIDDQRTYD